MNRMSRIELLTALSQMLPGQFDLVVSFSGVPPQYLSASSAPQATRAGEVVRYFQSRLGGLNDLAGVVDQVRGSAGAPPAHQGGGQTIINKGSIGQQVNVKGGATFNFSGTPTASPTAAPSSAAPSTGTSPSPSLKKPVKLFYSYSHKDESYREELEEHLANLRRQGVISEWHDRKITAGSEWAGEISKYLEEADIVLLLISSSFMASDYCHDLEMGRALERHEEGTARVVPIVLRPVDWKGAPFAKLQMLPRDAKPVSQWSDRDEAWLNVTQGIRNVVG